MSDRLNWFIVASDDTTTTLDPSTTARYDLLNEYALQRLVYERTEYGINLGWAELNHPSPDPQLNVVRQGPDTSPITYGALVAIGIRGSYLYVGDQDDGINLRWSGSPVYDWRIAGSGMQQGLPVQLGQPVGLYNRRTGDTLFYDPRRRGINLKWLSDKGKFNSRPWYESFFDAISGVFDQLLNVLGEVLARTINLADFLLTMVGIMIQKELRVRILILRDSQGDALLADDGFDQDPAKFAEDGVKLQRAADVIRECLARVNVTAVVGNDSSVYEILPFPAPAQALDVKCKKGALGEDYKSTGSYFRRHSNGAFFGSPITIFVVNDVEGKTGCSLGPLSNYVTVEASGFDDYAGTLAANEPRPTTPMHEIGHACGLWHKKVPAWETDIRKRSNLMKSGTPRGTRLTRSQRAILRASRHMRYAPTTTGTITTDVG